MHFSLDFFLKGSYIWITMRCRYETQILMLGRNKPMMNATKKAAKKAAPKKAAAKKKK